LYDRSNDELLASQVTNSIAVKGLDDSADYYFMIRARDYNNNTSTFSNMISTTGLYAIFNQDKDSLDFGCIKIGNSGTLQFTITNSGNSTLKGSITAYAPFSISYSDLSRNISAKSNLLSFEILAGGNQTFNLQFTPLQPGQEVNEILITCNDFNYNSSLIHVSGIGFSAPQVHFSISSHTTQITWEPVAGAVGYKIYKASSPNGSFALQTIIIETFYPLPMDTPMGFYQITAISEE
jgi:hypothetical protein